MSDQKQPLIQQASDQNHTAGDNWFIGITGLLKIDLLKAKAGGEKLRIVGYELLTIRSELDDLVLENVEEIRVRGKGVCSDRVKQRFGLK